MEGKLIEALGTALGLVAMYLLSLAIAWIRAHTSTARQGQLKELAAVAAGFAQQVYVNLSGPERFDKALAWLAGQARRAGLKVTDEQLRGFLEAAVRAAKDQFGDQWGKLGQESGAETT